MVARRRSRTPYRIAVHVALGACLVALGAAELCLASLLEGGGAPLAVDADPTAASTSGAEPPAAGAPAAAEQLAPVGHAATAGEGLLEVLVTQQGAPHEGAEVRVYVRHGLEPATGAPAWRLASTAPTRADGVAAIPAAPGTYFLAVRAAGFAARHVALTRPAGEARTQVAVSLVQAVAVAGRVLAKGSNEPVSLAALSLVPADARGGPVPMPVEERTSAIADSSGRFRFAVAPGPYVLEATATGFSRARIPLTAPQEGVEVRLAAGAVVEGFVRGPDGAPAAGAEVLLAGGDDLVRGTVGSSGGFAVEVTPGTYSVSARSDRSAGSWPVPVTVAAGGRARGIEIWLGTPGAITGVVTTGDGAPLQGASIAVSPHEAGGEFARAETDAHGRFAVDALGAGSYTVGVSADGWSPSVRSGVALLAGERLELAFALQGAGGVQGLVKDASGRPLAGVRVRARRRAEAGAGSAEVEARTDEAGQYRLGGLDAGPSEVLAARDDASSGASASVEVSPGSWARADFTLAETGRLEGLVTRRDRGPVGRVVVVVLPRGSAVPAASAKVEADGRYTLQLAAGEYRAFAAPAEDASPGIRQAPAPVRIAPGQVSMLDLVMKGPAGGSGPPAVVQVREPGGSASAGTLVMITAGDDLRSAGSAITDEEGFARVDLAEHGKLLVRAFRGGRVGGPVPLAESGPTVVAMRAASQLRGRVAAPDGPPVAGFTLELVALGDDASVASSIGGAAGMKSAHGVESPQRLEFGGDRFELTDVPAGPVRIMVRTPSGRFGHTQLELAPGELRDVELALEPGATVEGRVIDARNRSPVAGASVIVLTEDRSPPRPETTTDAAGRFRLTGLPTGSRRLRLVAPGYAPADREADVGHLGNVDLGDVALTGAPDTTATR